MSTFIAFLSQITPEQSTAASNPFATPTPRDNAALFVLVRDQLATLATTAPTPENAALLRSLVEALAEDVAAPPASLPGVPAAFVDALDRVPRARLRPDHTCPICAEPFLADPYPLVVQLPCHHSHRFDLECVEPWLRSKGSCPMCRKDFSPKPREVPPPGEGAEADEEDADMYG